MGVGDKKEKVEGAWSSIEKKLEEISGNSKCSHTSPRRFLSLFLFLSLTSKLLLLGAFFASHTHSVGECVSENENSQWEKNTVWSVRRGRGGGEEERGERRGPKGSVWQSG